MIEYPVTRKQVCLFYRQCVFIFQSTISYFGNIPLGTIYIYIYTHTHTHTYIYIYIYIYVMTDAWKQRSADEDYTAVCQLKKCYSISWHVLSALEDLQLTTTRNLRLWLSHRTYTISISSEQHVRSRRQVAKLNVFETGSGSCPVGNFFQRYQWHIFNFYLLGT